METMTYQLEIYDKNWPDRFEHCFADSDIEAIKDALTMCKEEGVMLLEMFVIDDDCNFVRSIDIDATLDAYIAELEAKKAEMDFSNMDNIRTTAQRTQDKLLSCLDKEEATQEAKPDFAKFIIQSSYYCPESKEFKRFTKTSVLHRFPREGESEEDWLANLENALREDFYKAVDWLYAQKYNEYHELISRTVCLRDNGFKAAREYRVLKNGSWKIFKIHNRFGGGCYISEQNHYNS